MKREPYFPRTIAARPQWFETFATQLESVSASLGLIAGETAKIAGDARELAYACGVWLKSVRDFSVAATASVEEYFRGAEGTLPFALPDFAPTPRPDAQTGPPAVPAVVPVKAGALLRIFRYVQTIKNSPAYTESTGLLLGIVGDEASGTEANAPTFTVKVELGQGCDCSRIQFQKEGHNGVAIYSRRGSGTWEFLAIDLATPYLDARPLLNPAVPEQREYRLRFFDKENETGDFSEVVKVTLAPA